MLVLIIEGNNRVDTISDYLDAENLADVQKNFDDDVTVVELTSLEDVPVYDAETQELYYINGDYIVKDKKPTQPSDDSDLQAFYDAVTQEVGV